MGSQVPDIWQKEHQGPESLPSHLVQTDEQLPKEKTVKPSSQT